MIRPYNNKGLFSDHYLSEFLPKTSDWSVANSEIEKAFDDIKQIYDTKKAELPGLNESQLEDRFIRPVLRRLGHVYEVQPSLPSTIEGVKRPDYAFFSSEAVRATAQAKAGSADFFKESLAIGEAKHWGRPLDRKLKEEKDPFERQNPSLQMSRYLWLTEVRWGILTDGRFWRLYERESSKRIDIFYEVDLAQLLERGNSEDFKYFYLLFRRGALQKDAQGLCLVDRIYQESLDYSKAVSEDLKERIYRALRLLAEGFYKNPENKLSSDSIQEIHDSALVFLYRLLFTLYAEYRDLLPLENDVYRDTYSLYSLKKEIKEKVDQGENFSPIKFTYWDNLKTLFGLINLGSESFGISKIDFYVPPYNGGLFDSEKHSFLEKYRVSDFYLAPVVDLLARTKDAAFIDYSSLEIRHLGSIYEGLLEYKLSVAEEDMVATREKGKEKWLLASKVSGTRVVDKAAKDELYLVTDRGERKATGSYYTPDYIVNYIIQNTLGSIIGEKQKLVQQNLDKVKEKVKSSSGYSREVYEKQFKKAEGSLIDEILSIKVLDPAMGSGHFLVEATDFLAKELVEALGESPEEVAEDDIRWARREVVERCIFGVDLNPLAVELAKLSLWLSTVAKDKTLSFLDHHLRCGNSLIGAKVEDLGDLPNLKKKKKMETKRPVQVGLFESVFREKVNILLNAFAQIESLPSDTVEQVREKDRFYEDFRRVVARFQDVADVWTSAYFENNVSWADYQKLQDNLRVSDEAWDSLRQEPWFKKAKQIAKEKHFFHWELEFPEVFFEGHQKRENPGFDAVVGNPPYVGFHGFEDQKPYLTKVYYACAGKFDIYIPFWELALEIARQDGTLSFICPSGFMKREHGAKLRTLLTTRGLLRNLHDFEDIQVFAGAVNYVCIPIFIRTNVVEAEESRKALVTFGEDPSIPTAQVLVSYKVSSDQPWEYSRHAGSVSEKIKSNPTILLREVSSTIAEGIVTGNNEVFLLNKNNPSHAELIDQEFVRPALRGECVDRYELNWDGTYLIYPYLSKMGRTVPVDENLLRSRSPQVYEYLLSRKEQLLGREYFDQSGKRWYELWNQRSIDHHSGRKLVIQENSVVNEFLLEEDGLFYLDTCCGVTFVPGIRYREHYFLTVLNSCLLDFVFKSITVPKAGGHFIHKPMYLARLPIRLISFSTPPKERQEQLEKAKTLYEDYLCSGNWSEILDFDDKLLEKRYDPDPELVEKHNADPLNKDWQIPEGARWEQSDVSHDLLAYLAEQMIEMNKAKRAEIKGFLEWLEREIGAEIEDLRNKTTIKAYHEHSLEDLLNTLKQNHRGLKLDPSRRDFQEKLQREFDNSLAKLTPLKEKIVKTDLLIDQIVYKLYGLTEEEIEIVEKS